MTTAAIPAYAAPENPPSKGELCLDLPAWFPQLNLNLTASAELFVARYGLCAATYRTYRGAYW